MKNHEGAIVKNTNHTIAKVAIGALAGLGIFTNGYCQANLPDIVDRNGYHYYRGSVALDRTYESPYYNNTGYYSLTNPAEGRYVYYHAYQNYNNGYYKGGFYGNEYYHNGHFNNGYYNNGECLKKSCTGYKGKFGYRGRLPGSK